MKFVNITLACVFAILVALTAVAAAAPQNGYSLPDPSTRGVLEVVEVVPILRDDRVQEDDGRYSFDIETGDDITASESGSPDGPEGAIVASGKYSYTAPDGTLIEVKYVANENGFQPSSDILPELPQFVKDQIAKAAEEDALAAATAARDAELSTLYQRPQ
ncbi:cuticle protein AMP1A-like isoform X1 [Penaeus chinensis]|uniref:cuticle protein AMP1A-like isoform X1 n=1 Tax=Penaeus chinensis TaxID=139456 RepID=UPI001FB62631|nr:cuticle protein AMP1A-like isoform X1 [Penaeus chinensis]